MSVDYHCLLWGELNKTFGDGRSTTFMMRPGQQLLSSDYDITGFADKAAYKTFELVNQAVPCATVYTPNQNNISTLWNTLLTTGKGPSAGPEYQAAYEKAKGVLYQKYPTIKTTYYQDYEDKKDQLNAKKSALKRELQDKYDDWEVRYQEALEAMPEYYQVNRLKKIIEPLEMDIKVWVQGPIAKTLAPFQEGRCRWLCTCAMIIMYVQLRV